MLNIVEVATNRYDVFDNGRVIAKVNNVENMVYCFYEDYRGVLAERYPQCSIHIVDISQFMCDFVGAIYDDGDEAKAAQNFWSEACKNVRLRETLASHIVRCERGLREFRPHVSEHYR